MNGIAHPAAHNIIVIIPVKQLYIACVKIMDGLILHISRTGIYAMGIQVLVRKKRRLLLFIVNEIPCGIVTPELNLPCGLKGCILIINMVQSLKLAEPIGVVQPAYIEQEIEADYADQRRILHIVGIFTLVAILISALGLVAMSTYYIQQKEQEVAVRKVFGSTRGEVLTRLVGNFMRLVGAAFVIAVPVAWYLLERWLQDYSVRISLSPLIFLASGAFCRRGGIRCRLLAEQPCGRFQPDRLD